MKKEAIIKFLTFIAFVFAFACEKKVNSDEAMRIEKRVFDGAELLSDQEEKDLSDEILSFEKKVGPQMAIVIVDTLNGERIEEFSLRTAEDLNLGRSKFDDGLLIAFSVKDRSIRIEVGYGLEKIIKDEIGARIIREDIVPKFKEKNFYEGFKVAVVSIEHLIEDKKALIGERP